jgi:hypothetical protein
MHDMIDADVFANLMRGIFTCYWCGGTADAEHIADHVDNCLKEIRVLNEMFTEKGSVS